jgi:transcription initiation factor TFIIIB Brf1 subunit/transcription initiation factor TFIIB
MYTLYAEGREKVTDVKAAAAASVYRACKECKSERTFKELNNVLEPSKIIKKHIARADRELQKVLQARLHEEAKRRGIDITDIQAVRELIMGSRSGGGMVNPEARAANHPSQQVPRFGSDLGFTQRGLQVRSRLLTLFDVCPIDVHVCAWGWHLPFALCWGSQH